MCATVPTASGFVISLDIGGWKSTAIP